MGKQAGKKGGDSVTTKTAELMVEGISCNHCVAVVKKALEQLSGIQRFEVDLKAKRVHVEYDPAAVNYESMKKAVENQGYRLV